MCGYDPFQYYEQELDRKAEAEYHGFNSWEEYMDAKEDFLTDQQMGLLEDERLGNL